MTSAIYLHLSAPTLLYDNFRVTDDPIGTQLPHPRIGRYMAQWRCQRGCRMLADFPLLITVKHAVG